MNSVGTVDVYDFCDSDLKFIGNRSEPWQSAYTATTDAVICKAETSIFYTTVSRKDFFNEMEWKGAH